MTTARKQLPSVTSANMHDNFPAWNTATHSQVQTICLFRCKGNQTALRTIPPCLSNKTPGLGLEKLLQFPQRDVILSGEYCEKGCYFTAWEMPCFVAQRAKLCCRMLSWSDTALRQTDFAMKHAVLPRICAYLAYRNETSHINKMMPHHCTWIPHAQHLSCWKAILSIYCKKMLRFPTAIHHLWNVTARTACAHAVF